MSTLCEFALADLSTVNHLSQREKMAWVLEGLLNESHEFSQNERELAYHQLDLYSLNTNLIFANETNDLQGQKQLWKIVKTWPDLEKPITEVVYNKALSDDSIPMVLSALTHLQEQWARESIDGINARQVTSSEWQSHTPVPVTLPTADPKRIELISVLSRIVHRSSYVNQAQKESAMAGMWSLINPNRRPDSLDGRMVDEGETVDTKIEYAERALASYPVLTPSVEALLTGGDVTDDMVTTAKGVYGRHKGSALPDGTVVFRYRP